LTRIESEAFRESSLKSIEIPRNVEILESSCFSGCHSLSSISFVPDSRLKHIETCAFEGVTLFIMVPASILFIASDAAPDSIEISIAGVDRSPEYIRWQRFRKSGMCFDFRRLKRFDSGLPSLTDCSFTFSGFVEKSELSGTHLISTQIYQEWDSEVCIVVKSINMSINEDKVSFERSIEKMMNLRHPCIAGVIGVALSSPLKGLKIVRMHIDGYSLSTVVLTSPEWWTPTAKAKAVVGVLLGLRFAHSLGVFHGHLTGKNIFVTEEGMIQISDFSLHNLFNEEGDKWVERAFDDFSGESLMPEADVHGFARILSEIVLGASCEGSGHTGDIPSFVSAIIERRQCRELKTVDPFTAILTVLKQNDFKIVEGVDIGEVSQFMRLIELSETLTE
jgi:hypothetical protein